MPVIRTTTSARRRRPASAAARCAASAGLLVGLVTLSATGTHAADATQAPASSGSPGSSSGSSSGSASGTVTWTVEPATADGPDGRISLRHALDPGASVDEHVVVTNFSDRPATFHVYAADGTVSADGDFDVRPSEDAPRDSGAWVTLQAPEGAEPVAGGGFRVALPAGGSLVVPLTVTVPAQARPGDHPAGVVAELVDDEAAVRVAARVGVRLHLRVTGDIRARVAPDDVEVRWEPSWNPFAPGTAHVRYVLRNEGDVRLGARAGVTLAGPAGTGEVSATTQVREVLPEGSASVETTVRLWPLVRASGEVEAVPVVVGDDVVDVALAPSAVPVVVWAVPWVQLVLLLLVVGVPVLVVRQRRRSARRVQARIDAALAAAGVAPHDAPEVDPDPAAA
ncbi:hypothetical protein [Cellulomonas uda]|uniref:DUF916 domain-containing protein n=1 Tax=Cellulomonas uda TaxID=1714 RepID=A0A4Y3K6U2_CELUD|nr:hypothetical protein [Cellulomonas uda]NII65204.1 hypothetical protein [Cellulomonas uda]GEA80251.1 hypothetical protein CUD01_06950 [Cellulomonas uda]